MSEITDGNYKILGKVVQICKDSVEISLLRNTVFSKLQLDKMKEFQDVFNDPALADFIGNGGITTTIEAPVIMIIFIDFSSVFIGMYSFWDEYCGWSFVS